MEGKVMHKHAEFDGDQNALRTLWGIECNDMVNCPDSGTEHMSNKRNLPSSLSLYVLVVCHERCLRQPQSKIGELPRGGNGQSSTMVEIRHSNLPIVQKSFERTGGFSFYSSFTQTAGKGVGPDAITTN